VIGRAVTVGDEREGPFQDRVFARRKIREARFDRDVRSDAPARGGGPVRLQAAEVKEPLGSNPARRQISEKTPGSYLYSYLKALTGSSRAERRDWRLTVSKARAKAASEGRIKTGRLRLVRKA